ncbi:MAG: dicarboxylate/amino acid:cation symporter [Clostridium sp.]|nr:dicarboxylate/amino acid:cation symporter [Clostridium sp.]
MRASERFIADEQHISEIVEFVRTKLDQYGTKKKSRIRAELTVEEVALSLISHKAESPNGGISYINITISGFLGTVSIEMHSEGTPYSLEHSMTSNTLQLEDVSSTEVQDTLRQIILSSYADSLKYRHRNGVNYIQMTVVRSQNAFLFQTLAAMAMAILAGLLFAAFVPADVNTAVNHSILQPVKTMYMNALKMIVAPEVFFSIISCIVQFSDLTALGRIGGKIVGIYLFTTFLAIFVGLGAFYLFKPGDASLASALIADVPSIPSGTSSVSVRDTIIGIIPTNIIDPFLRADMLQLIFLAAISGVATNLIGKYSEKLKDLFQACNDLFMKITALIIKMMPIAVFCSIMSIMITLGIGTLLSSLAIMGTFLFGLLCMMVCYCILMIVLGRMDPFPFVKKYAPYMLQVFSMASSNASIPINMDVCEKKIGIDKKIYSLSIPLCATLNMDGTCVHLAVFALALAKTYGIELSAGTIFSMVLTILILSIGAAGIPGAGLICLSVLLTQINVPIEAIGLVMGIDSVCGMFRCMSNCLGDVVASTIVAKSEHMLNMDIYSSKS